MDFNEQFQKSTGGKFPYIKFTAFVVDNYTGSLVLNAVYDSHVIKRAELENIKGEIDEAAGMLLGNRPYQIKYAGSRYSFTDIAEEVLEFFHKASMTVFAALDKENISVAKEGDVLNVTIKIPEGLSEITDIDRYTDALEKYLNETGFSKHRVFVEKYTQDFKKIHEDLERERVVPMYKYALEGGRTINPNGRVRCFKKSVGGVAGYIADQHEEGFAVLYGKIGNTVQREYKDKKNEKITHKFVTFTLNDTTATIKCTYFDKTKEQNMVNFIEDGKFIIARGKLEQDSYAKDGALKFLVTLFDLCEETIFTINEITRKLGDSYLVVHPEEYKSHHQDILFGTAAECPFEKMVIFDLYTATESGREEGNLLEIAAVKIDGGKITETFSTFVNPKKDVPLPVRRNLHLSPSDYVAGPTFDKVLPDFKLFCNGYPLGSPDPKHVLPVLNEYYKRLLFETESPESVTDIAKVLKENGSAPSAHYRLLDTLKDIASILGA